MVGGIQSLPAQGNRLREQRLQEQVYVLCKIIHFMQKMILPRNNIKIGLATPRFAGSLDLSSYSSFFSSLYKSTGPKCQYLVLSVDSFLYSCE